MKGWLASVLRAFWRGDLGLAAPLLVVLTLPLSILYGSVIRSRNLLYDYGILPSREAPIPVVSVGNLAVGGTGKTPVAGWLVSTLREEGRRPALVARGYGEDELMLHRRWNPDVPVIRAPQRINGIREAVELGCDVAVLDDAFQHRSVARDLDLVLLSPAHPLPPRLLPRGPFRESLRSLRRADALLVIQKGKGESESALALTAELNALPGSRRVHLIRLVPADWQGLDGEGADPPEGPLLAVTSVAEPEAFVELVAESVGQRPELLSFPDHHAYGEADAGIIAGRGEGMTVVTTEKDAVKLQAFKSTLPPVRVLPLVPALSSTTRSLLGSLLVERVGKGSGRPGKVR